MVESIGICEKHSLPLDKSGECELCRLSDMPSKAPPERSAWWAVIVPVGILLLGALLTYLAVLSDGTGPAQQGVQPVAPAAPLQVPEPESEEAEPEELAPAEPAPVRVPPRSTPPSPDQIPIPDDFKR